MSDFGLRLREERERIGLNQSEFAERCGVKKLAQLNYEKGVRNPDSAYLAAASGIGVDVLYVLTGQHNPAVSVEQQALTPRQSALLDNYDNTSEEGKKIIEAAASAAAQSSVKRSA